jgi:hypothetical protein
LGALFRLRLPRVDKTPGWMVAGRGSAASSCRGQQRGSSSRKTPNPREAWRWFEGAARLRLSLEGGLKRAARYQRSGRSRAVPCDHESAGEMVEFMLPAGARQSRRARPGPRSKLLACRAPIRLRPRESRSGSLERIEETASSAMRLAASAAAGRLARCPFSNRDHAFQGSENLLRQPGSRIRRGSA